MSYTNLLPIEVIVPCYLGKIKSEIHLLCFAQ